MQTFSKNKLALAIGSALMVMAGTASAVNGVPAYRAPVTSSALITQIGGGTANADVLSMLTAGGIVNTGITVDVALDSGAGATADGAVGSATAGVISVVGGNPLAIGGVDAAAATAATNHIVVYTGTTATPVPSNGALAVLGNTTDGVAHVTISLPAPGANKGYRINAGALEYSADTAAATPTWTAVKVLIRDVAAKEIYSEEGTAGGFVSAADFELTTTGITLNSVGTSLAPTPVVKTIGAPTAASPLINGFAIDTIVPIDTFTIVTNVAVTPRNAGGIFAAVNAATPFTAATGLSGTAFTADSATGTVGTAVAATKTQPPSFKNTLTFKATADWTDGAAADDAIFATSPLAFNTGVDGAELPVTVAAGTTAPKYTQVFNVADGTATTVTLPNATSGVIDAVAPVLVAGGVTFSTPTADDPSETNLSVLFSENMATIGGDDLREILENIFVGGSSLADLSLNALNNGIKPTGAAFALVGAQDKLTISALATESVATHNADGTWTGKSITVKPGITFQERNDTGYVEGTDALDDQSGTGPNGQELAGGIQSASGVVEALAEQSLDATAPDASIAWGTNTSAEALPPAGADPVIQTVVVTLDTPVKLTPSGTVFGTATTTAAKTATDLKNNLVIDVYGTNGIKFQVKPSAATLDSSTKITVTLPTALIYQKLAGQSLKTVWIGYVAGGNNSTNNTLMGVSPSASGKNVPVDGGLTDTVNGGANGEWETANLTAAGAEPVVLPLVFTANPTGGQSTLLTQSIQPTVVGAAQNSIVRAYLARWEDKPGVDHLTADILSGNVSSASDKISNLAIEFADQNALEGLIENQLQTAEQSGTGELVLSEKAISGVQDAVKASGPNAIPVYVKLVRSNDTANANAQNGSQNYLNARAILATTVAAARAAGDNTNDNNSPIYEALLDPKTGAIKGRITGTLNIKVDNHTATRGLIFLDENGLDNGTTPVLIGSALVGAGSSLDLLMGIDPRDTKFDLSSAKPFVLLVHESSTKTNVDDNHGGFTLLTSADPNAKNYLPFAPDWQNKASGAAKRAEVKLSVTDVKSFALPRSENWALYGIGNPAVVQPGKSDLPRMLVGLNTISGLPTSFWANDTDANDMALQLAGNKVGVATELNSDFSGNSGPTLTSMSTGTEVSGAVGLAWSNDNGPADGAPGVAGKIYVAQAQGEFAPAKAPAASKVAAGWSLVTVPASGVLNTTNIDAVIKVGAHVNMGDDRADSGEGNGQFSWFAGEDGALPAGSVTAGEAVFVHSAKGGDL